MRGATLFFILFKRVGLHFNPRTPCGVRHGAYGDKTAIYAISIHAPHAGCDRPHRLYLLSPF